MKINTQSLRKAFIVSILISLAIPPIEHVLTVDAVKFDDELDWKRVELMSQRDAREYVEQHSTPVSGFENLVYNLQAPSYYPLLLKKVLFYLSITFGACFVTNVWSNRDTMGSGLQQCNTVKERCGRDIPSG